MMVPPFVDHALSARLEAVEVAQLADLVRAVSVRVPDRRAASLPLAGGIAAFVGARMSVSRAAGLGMAGPVEDADVAALVDFYGSRGADARILASPFAHESLLARLGEHGFRLAALDTMLVRRLGGAGGFPAPAPGVAVRPAAFAEAAAWVRTSLLGFGAWEDPPSPDALGCVAVFQAAFEDSFEHRHVVYYLASCEGVPAGGAGLYVRGRTGYLFAASTLAAHRGRGVQAALIVARLAAARDAGCELVFTGTAPGSASQRNFERLGFAPVYSQALLRRSFG
jgi:GNAT superfamily N-acetyltransferase